MEENIYGPYLSFSVRKGEIKLPMRENPPLIRNIIQKCLQVEPTSALVIKGKNVHSVSLKSHCERLEATLEISNKEGLTLDSLLIINAINFTVLYHLPMPIRVNNSIDLLFSFLSSKEGALTYYFLAKGDGKQIYRTEISQKEAVDLEYLVYLRVERIIKENGLKLTVLHSPIGRRALLARSEIGVVGISDKPPSFYKFSVSLPY